MFGLPIYAWICIGCYLLGSIPTGVLITRGKYGIDVREMGSGNIGATNVTRVFGWYAGALTFLIDFAKGALPFFFIVSEYGSDAIWISLAAFLLIFGHCFSPYLGFRGGKGVATSLGVLVVISPWLAGIAAVTYAITLALTRISAVGSLAGVLAALAALPFLTIPPSFQRLVWSVCFLVLVRHVPNIRRLFSDWQKRRGTQ